MNNHSLNNIRFVLVRTFHPGNIGSAARSMKTMGLSDLCLVSPKQFPDPEAEKMAAGAKDMIDNIRVESSLYDAVADCTVVAASTARPRGYDLPELSPEAAAKLLIENAKSSPVALIFGPERMGLHNDDLKLAKYRITIPANPDYCSLNLASAVQILSYEIYKAGLADNTSTTIDAQQPQFATTEDTELLHQHLESVLHEIRFLRPHQGETLLRIRHLLTRAQLTQQDLNILRGILSGIERAIAKNKL